MFDQSAAMFEGYRTKLKKIKKKTYEERFDRFFNENRPVLDDKGRFYYPVGGYFIIGQDTGLQG